MSKITEALQKAAREREERLHKLREKNGSVPPPPVKETSEDSPHIEEPAPPSEEIEKTPVSLQEALRRRKKKTPRPTSSLTKETAPSGLDPHLVAYLDPHSSAAKQYSLIRTNLQSMNTCPLRTLVISSATYGEGKTVTAINLAITIAQDTKKPVLLIDGDLRKPQVAHYLGLNPATGLINILTEGASLESAILNTEINNLSVLPGENKVIPNLSSLLESEQMKELLTEVKTLFEYVIIDTAPVLSATDTGIISQETDGVLLTIQADRTKKEVISRAQSVLTEAKAKIIGSVLTHVQYPIPDFIYRRL